MTRTMIHATNDDGLKGKTADGRHVEFSQCMWAWVYTDTDGDAPVEKVRLPQVIRK